MLLLIPGPVTTDARVRAAAAQDYAPWDLDFRDILARVRGRVTAIAGLWLVADTSPWKRRCGPS